jgi:tetratricopeptide (TPR) repeat protein
VSHLRFMIYDLRLAGGTCMRGHSRWWIILFLFVACIGKTFAADGGADFNAANRLYAEGKFADAAAAYEKILGSGAVSPHLLFNYGNAEFKSGNSGKAIAALRKAEMLAPRDSEIRANLAFVRNRVQGATLPESRWQNSLNQFTLNEWTGSAAVAFWATFLLLAARRLWPAWAPKLKTATFIFALLTILTGAASGLRAAEHFSKQTAVVIEPQVTARSGPFDEAQSSFVAHDGAELSVLARHEDWVQLADGSGRVGWVPVKQVEIVPDA